MTLFPHLHDFCRSKSWRAVYLDEVSGIFVRVTPQNASWTERLQVDCDKISFTPPATRSRSEMFNFSANAGGVLYSLEHYPEALAHLDEAQSMFPENASVHLFRGLVLQQMGRNSEAESEFRVSLSLEANDEASFDLGLFYIAERRYGDAAEVFHESAQTSSRPHEMWMMLGQSYLGLRQPQPALEAFDKAVESSPFHNESECLGANFNSLIATGRAKAWFQLGDVAQAVSYQEEAVRLAPEDSKLWLGLANLYQVHGDVSKAAEAKTRAQALGSR
jgi:Flp pilus assembly protein TadD